MLAGGAELLLLHVLRCGGADFLLALPLLLLLDVGEHLVDGLLQHQTAVLVLQRGQLVSVLALGLLRRTRELREAIARGQLVRGAGSAGRVMRTAQAPT